MATILDEVIQQCRVFDLYLVDYIWIQSQIFNITVTNRTYVYRFSASIKKNLCWKNRLF